MKLSAFKIKNYRSIVNTGWISLSPDNITTLIGQNESGKTSVLEALFSFSNAYIDDDILRSDMSLPVVSCEFLLSADEVKSLSETDSLGEKIKLSVRASKKLFLTREWTSKTDSILYYGNDEFLEEHSKIKEKERQNELSLLEKAQKAITDDARLRETIASQEDQLRTAESSLKKLQSRRDKLAKLAVRNGNSHDSTLEGIEHDLQTQVDNKEKLASSFTTNREKLEKSTLKANYARKYQQAFAEITALQKQMETLRHETNAIKENLAFVHKPRTLTRLRKDLRKASESLQSASTRMEECSKSFLFSRECFEYSLLAQIYPDLEMRARDSVHQHTSTFTPGETGEYFFEFIPEITLFEDFSSLLPNRIDLDDILTGNIHAEGYNAARNFLIVSGLDSSFFRESNSRILKQKIENLNGEITLHFQGYWRQNLGKNNKIRLNFELEHYDLSHPEKKGKPYLEFWIKDEHERLYPKQRSRGVRWFLSFYLELQATALQDNKKGKILLIDEPGLSLHARAQEDVLKVFEDLKSDIQVLYSTHSPHLVTTGKLYRLLAVQRANELDDRSESKVYDARSLASVSGDTLSPVYTLLGTQLSNSDFLREKNNLLVEDTTVFYYLKTLFRIFQPSFTVFLLPSTSVAAIPQLVNLLTGWRLHFGVLLTAGAEADKVYKEIKAQLFKQDEPSMKKRILYLKDLKGIENLFSTLDFKKHVLRHRTGITESNLDYTESAGLDRTELATSFALHCQNSEITQTDFDEESSENISMLIAKIMNLLS
jgi:predicted ATP-dependent endonuclease of OLD family